MAGKRERERAFIENGGLVLEKLVASCNGRPIPIRTFSYQEIILATNNFDHRLILYEDSFSTSYKGSFEGRILSIKSYNRNNPEKDMAVTDIAISAKMSAHKNTLKLVGCCLETSIPIVVFESAQNGVLSNRLYISRQQGTPMVWQSRLKIARQIAHAIAYLHTAFSRPIIHRDIRPGNIFLDEHDVPKLTGFSLSISIPEGETAVEDLVRGSYGYLCPTYFQSSLVTEKVDVYSFGIVLFQLLTGQVALDLWRLSDENNESMVNYMRNQALNEIEDPGMLAEEGGAGVEQQLQAVRQLALTCIEDHRERRPTMVDVTKELRRIERSMA